ncbi:MAG: tRNA pseudouridine(55) synthase TruB [Dehalococcoidales bacterium]|nr:tRNA pseudouridine(55) synthase TruB [Dehalococcoidales bacterium]
MDGIFNINKPAGKTSFGVVALIKRLTGERRVGHAGTLDPNATGVLPVCLGQGTRIVEFLMDARKTYRAVVELGKATDTHDGSGKIVYQGDISGIDINKLQEALEKFRGDIEQVPPMYSAVKHKGQPLYRLARAGIAVKRKSRKVTIHRLELISWEPPLATLDIECSKGTYIRSLAYDLGEGLGCGAYLKDLVRTSYGIFDIKDAVSLEQLEKAIKKGNRQQYLFPIDSVLQDIPALTVDEDDEAAIKTGNLIKQRENDDYDNQGKYRRAYSQGGRFLAILIHDKDKGVWRPEKVLI